MHNVLVVEDEILVAAEIESVIEEIGYRAVGIAADMHSALALADQADIALVDLNLLDGATGPIIGKLLAERYGVAVLFMTANPAQLGPGIPGTMGVLSKPVSDSELRQAIAYLAAVADQRPVQQPPARLKLFRHSAAA